MEANAVAVAAATGLPSSFSPHSLAGSTGFAVASWYSASLANNYATPSLLDLLGNPLTLNMLEQAGNSMSTWCTTVQTCLWDLTAYCHHLH